MIAIAVPNLLTISQDFSKATQVIRSYQELRALQTSLKNESSSGYP